MNQIYLELELRLETWLAWGTVVLVKEIDTPEVVPVLMVVVAQFLGAALALHVQLVQLVLQLGSLCFCWWCMQLRILLQGIHTKYHHHFYCWSALVCVDWNVCFS